MNPGTECNTNSAIISVSSVSLKTVATASGVGTNTAPRAAELPINYSERRSTITRDRPKELPSSGFGRRSFPISTSIGLGRSRIHGKHHRASDSKATTTTPSGDRSPLGLGGQSCHHRASGGGAAPSAQAVVTYTGPRRRSGGDHHASSSPQRQRISPGLWRRGRDSPG